MIYRVHKYPILTPLDSSNDTQLGLPSKDQYANIINANTGSHIHPDIIPYLDGLHHYDEICTALRCSPQELDEQLQGSSDNTTWRSSSTRVAISTAENNTDRYHGEYEQHQHNTDADEDFDVDDKVQWTVKFIYR